MSSDAPPEADGGLTVMVVEDDGFVAEELILDLRDNGHRVVGSAATTHDAIELAEQHEIDVALVDVNLDRNGFGGDVAEMLLRRHGVRSIFISGHLGEPNRDALLSLEPYAMLAKPYNYAELAAVLRIVPRGSS